MLNKIATRIGLAAALLVAFQGVDLSAQADGMDIDGIVEELTEELGLSDEQVGQVTEALQGFGMALAEATATAEDEEPDTQAMMGAVKAARAEFQSDMESILSEEQLTALDALVDEVFQEIFEGLAELKITDLRAPLELTDEQADALKPVMGTAMRGMVAVIIDYSDKRMGARNKLGMANKLKKIQSDMNAGMGEILTPEQIEKHQAMKEAQKEAQKED
ncbi:MAG: hypothetical protein V3R71_02125 [Gemmatimonadales bacterium]